MLTDDPVNAQALKHSQRTARGERQPSYEVEVRAKDASVHRLELTEYPVPNVHGDVEFVEGIAHDITDRRHAERRLAENERRLRAILENEPECVKLVGPDGTVLAMNPAGLVMVEATSEADVVGRSVYDLVCPEHHACYRTLNETVFRGEVASAEFEIVGQKGTRRWMETRAAPLRDEEGRIFAQLAITRDVTPRRLAEQALRASEVKYRAFFEENLAGSYVATPEGRVLACNRSFARMTGFGSVEETAGASLWSCYPSGEAVESFLETLRRLGRLENHQHELRRKDGTPIHVIENAVGRFNERGDLVEIHGFLIDDSERRKAEAQLRQAQKIDAVGRLAGGVAHDFNNLLGVITGYCDLLQKDIGARHPGQARLGQIRKAAERAAGLTRQLLAFSRKQVLEPKVLDLNGIVKDIEKMLRRLIGEDIELVTRLQPDLERVKADPGQLEQVIVNLAVNARDAMPRGGRLVIDTSNVDLDDAYARAHPGMKPGVHAMLTVADTGQGMDPDTLLRIFEPFFTTKEVGKGTGLGLAMVYGIVKQSGGYITVYSEPGQGSTFKIYLPRVEAATEAPAAAPTVGGPVRGGTETVLLLEDEASLRAVIRDVLETAGYSVLDAGRPETALSTAEAHDGPIHLMLTDIIMPQMNGREVAQRIRAKRPRVSVLYMSGYTQEIIDHRGILEPGVDFIAKPFEANALLRRVREILDRAARS